MLNWFNELSLNAKACAEKKRCSLTQQPHWSPSLKSYLSTQLPQLDDPIDQIQLVALDFETTGLCFKSDQLLSVGSVDLTHESINFASSQEVFINHGRFVKARSACINQITPQQLSSGIEMELAMDQLLHKIAGKVVLAHGALIEKAFIDRYFKDTYQLNELPCHFIDTLSIEKKYSFSGRSKQHTSYQLDALRTHYRLPAYHSHSAASDAASCAELFLVQLKKLKLQPSTTTLRQICL